MSEQQRPPQSQEPPGTTDEMTPRPKDEMADYEGRGLLTGRKALITGGDSGIGRAVAVAFAKEGADVAIAYLSEHEDAEHTVALVEAAGRRAVAVPGDLSEEAACRHAVATAVEQLGGLDLLVNNIARQRPVDSLAEVSTEEWEATFRTNVHSYFWCTQAALEHMPDGSAIINTGSVNGLRGNRSLLAYATTKGAVHVFTKSMAQALLDRRIRVNCVAPGPVWTPLIPATMPPEKTESFGSHATMDRVAQPDEIAPSFVFLASERMSGYFTGQVLAPVGGETHPG
ncbi:MAG TPA: SDR family oxidoreductase [Acidimicrobiales bacterium]|nr:SDR family oxidoreductase [Acidimicrobiales bacterium]